jgi:bacterioferritin-associated ferredoxin
LTSDDFTTLCPATTYWGPKAVIICLCNALGERECREAAARPGVKGPGCIYRQFGCRVRCGACVATMSEIVEHGRRATAVELVPTLVAELREK